MSSPQNMETTRRRKEKEATRVREKTHRPVHTPGSLPPHFSDPSHSPVSELTRIRLKYNPGIVIAWGHLENNKRAHVGLACNWREMELLFVNTEFCKTLEAEQPQYAACRSLLRAGPASSLRMNIRAVAQYADEAGNDRTASNDVDQCLRALEELDSLLLNASRNERGASVKSMKSNIGIAVSALNSLLQTVPTDILKKGKAIADAYNSPDEDFAPQNLDPNLKQLESIL